MKPNQAQQDLALWFQDASLSFKILVPTVIKNITESFKFAINSMQLTPEYEPFAKHFRASLNKMICEFSDVATKGISHSELIYRERRLGYTYAMLFGLSCWSYLILYSSLSQEAHQSSTLSQVDAASGLSLNAFQTYFSPVDAYKMLTEQFLPRVVELYASPSWSELGTDFLWLTAACLFTISGSAGPNALIFNVHRPSLTERFQGGLCMMFNYVANGIQSVGLANTVVQASQKLLALCKNLPTSFSVWQNRCQSWQSGYELSPDSEQAHAQQRKEVLHRLKALVNRLKIMANIPTRLLDDALVRQELEGLITLRNSQLDVEQYFHRTVTLARLLVGNPTQLSDRQRAIAAVVMILEMAIFLIAHIGYTLSTYNTSFWGQLQFAACSMMSLFGAYSFAWQQSMKLESQYQSQGVGLTFTQDLSAIFKSLAPFPPDQKTRAQVPYALMSWGLSLGLGAYWLCPFYFTSASANLKAVSNTIGDYPWLTNVVQMCANYVNVLSAQQGISRFVKPLNKILFKTFHKNPHLHTILNVRSRTENGAQALAEALTEIVRDLEEYDRKGYFPHWASEDPTCPRFTNVNDQAPLVVQNNAQELPEVYMAQAYTSPLLTHFSLTNNDGRYIGIEMMGLQQQPNWLSERGQRWWQPFPSAGWISPRPSYAHWLDRALVSIFQYFFPAERLFLTHFKDGNINWDSSSNYPLVDASIESIQHVKYLMKTTATLCTVVLLIAQTYFIYPNISSHLNRNIMALPICTAAVASLKTNIEFSKCLRHIEEAWREATTQGVSLRWVGEVLMTAVFASWNAYWLTYAQRLHMQKGVAGMSEAATLLFIMAPIVQKSIKTAKFVLPSAEHLIQKLHQKWQGKNYQSITENTENKQYVERIKKYLNAKRNYLCHIGSSVLSDEDIRANRMSPQLGTLREKLLKTDDSLEEDHYFIQKIFLASAAFTASFSFAYALIDVDALQAIFASISLCGMAWTDAGEIVKSLNRRQVRQWDQDFSAALIFGVLIIGFGWNIEELIAAEQFHSAFILLIVWFSTCVGNIAYFMDDFYEIYQRCYRIFQSVGESSFFHWVDEENFNIFSSCLDQLEKMVRQAQKHRTPIPLDAKTD